MKTKRLTMRLDDVTMKRIDDIKDLTRATNTTQAINYALIIAAWMLKEQARGREIVTRKAGEGTNPRNPQAVVKFIFG